MYTHCTTKNSPFPFRMDKTWHLTKTSGHLNSAEQEVYLAIYHQIQADEFESSFFSKNLVHPKKYCAVIKRFSK